MESVLSGRNLILELSLKVDEKKTCFFRGGRKLKAPKLDCGPERTDSILLVFFFSSSCLLSISDGVGASCVFCAIMIVLDQIEYSQTVDVFQAVRRLRLVRPQAVRNLVSFKKFDSVKGLSKPSRALSTTVN